jgi:hypothetical protein
MAATLTLAADAPADEGAGFVMGLLETIESHRDELVKIDAGQTGVNGYAVFGNNPPKDLMTGDLTVDQLYSAHARVQILKAEIDVAYRALILTTADAMGWEIEPYGKHLQTMDIPTMQKELPKLAGVPDAYGDDLFVLSMTQAILHRQPTADELAEALEKLEKPNYTRDKYVNELFKSKEYKQAKRTDEEYIIDVLQATAGRRPETGDLPAWKKKMGLNRHAFLQTCLADPPDLGQGRGTTDNDESHDDDQTATRPPEKQHTQPRAEDKTETKDDFTWSVLMRESFEDDDEPRGWDFDEADESDIDDGCLRYELEDDGEYILYEGRPIPLDNVEITFRGRCEDSGFRVLLIGRGGLVGAAMGIDDNRRSEVFLGTGSTPAATGTGKVFKEKEWHAYRIRRVGPTIEAWCDGRKIVAGKGDAAVKGTGKLSFTGEEGKYRIDDLVIRTGK